MNDELYSILDSACSRGTLIKCILSRPVASEKGRGNVTVQPVSVRGETVYQFTAREGSRETHENVAADRAAERIVELLETTFRDCHLFTTQADYTVRRSKQGRLTIKKKPPTQKLREEPAHDRTKNYLIPEGEPCAFLAEIGVMTAGGKVRAAKYHKFRQINRFLELVNDIIPSLPAEGVLHIVDFGCGKSYLTFALHHLLTAIHGREVELTGLDRNEDVIADCRRIADKLHCRGLSFQVGDIAGFEADRPVDLVVSLHACDTATDDALAQAVRWTASVILAVPCCQHEVAARLDDATFRSIGRHGILKERFAALLTDALRAEVLEQHGYATQIVEFIDMEHTAKNVLIRAVRRSGESAPPGPSTERYEQLKSLAGLQRLHIEDVLKAD